MEPYDRKCHTVAITSDNYGTSENTFLGSSIGGPFNIATINSATEEKSYSTNTYFKPLQNQPNLHLVTKAQVEKIILDKESGEAIAKGVKVTVKGIETSGRRPLSQAVL
ncbi:hypothetical protein sscle_10g078640 [Sclerotinia sclerotiorum 1980 UF-70]|uniref:Glucose-methanol-choline oxidoreductase N-terminal domain-containing protein n=1 Tax=Sclerotinia sclerotiorum (strain ATCC 18683 / 1980 / Ss-1) TaxID=665079 RepID=A0A1D9QDR2_SCLS1|nr:hypothetical protein sscle_10g078640 [Sclerotinia sclerotiorum 1980 UF-70]